MKRNADSLGVAPNPTAFEKAGETFNLLTATVDALQRANLYLAFVPLLCPRKTPYYKVFARPFSKGRVPLAYSSRTSRTPRVVTQKRAG